MNVCAIALVKLTAAASCLISGDSIALDLAQAMPQCAVDAQNCIPSSTIIARVHTSPVLIVSAGSNDPHSANLAANLRAIRARATGRVIWIVPSDWHAAAVVRGIAVGAGDKTITFKPGRDHVHLANNRALAASVRAAMK
jgi:hypothetical protein